MSKPRSIFEEVSDEKAATAPPKPAGGVIDGGRTEWRRPMQIWLYILFALVVLMIVVGGLTRLTDSGLSITEWAPLAGALPPMSEAAWLSEFERYKQIPEYQLQNRGMELSEFKTIYWWEWGHRQLGRFVGLVWAIGALFFLFRYTIPKFWKFRMFFVGFLGGLQGLIGWWMVSSGLSGDAVDVASYRLATHLGLAFIILGVLIWFAWLLNREEMALFQARRQADAAMIPWGKVFVALVFVQILLGALVAGIDAGRSFTDWPLMGGEVIPSDSFYIAPAWRNFFENPGLVQFNHRLFGYLVLGLAVYMFIRSRKSAHAAIKRGYLAAKIGVSLQVVLGIVTVLYAAPLNIAIVHQLLAVFVWVLVIRGLFTATYPPQQGLRA